MDIMELGAIGELVGGVAVIATLGYLAAQVRYSARASRSAGYQAATAAIANQTRHMGSDIARARVFHRGLYEPEALDEDQRIQWALLFTSSIRNFENLHYQYEIGTIDEGQWLPWAARIRGVFAAPGARAWWAEQRDAYSPGFRTFVEDSTGAAVPVITEVP